MSNQKEFPKGLYFNEPHQSAPDFVKGQIRINRKQLIEWLQSKKDEYINIDVLNSREGKPYVVVNDFKPEYKETVSHTYDEPTVYDTEDGLPF